MVAVVFVVPRIKSYLLHRLSTWKSRITNFTSKEEVPAAKFDIDKDAQIAHAPHSHRHQQRSW